jgi:hypothetical protein
MFGLSEFINGDTLRTNTVKCVSQTAIVYSITRTNFIDLVHTYKFTDTVLEEHLFMESRLTNKLHTNKKLQLSVDKFENLCNKKNKREEDYEPKKSITPREKTMSKSVS